MKRVSKFIAFILAVLCLVPAVSSCGSDDSKGGYIVSGIEKAEKDDYLVNGLGLQTGPYELHFTKKSERYGLAFKAGDETIFLQDSPVQLTVSEEYGLVGVREKSLACGYDSVKKHEYGFAASVKLSSEGGSVFRVNDLWFISAEGVFNLSRNIVVEKSGKTEKGFNSMFTVSASSQSGNIEDYDITLPSLVYRDSSHIPQTAIGAELDVEALFAKETRMGMPYVFIRDRKENNAITVSHYQPQVSTEGIVGGGVHGEADEGIQYGSLGYINDKESGLSAGFVYPCKEGPTYYGGSGWATRFHPIEKGVKHQYKLSVIPQADASYNDAFTYATLKAYGNGLADLFNADLDAVYDVSIGLLSDRYSEYGTGEIKSAGLPFAVPLDKERENTFSSPSMQMGFVGAQTSLAAQMIKVGYEKDDLSLISKGTNMIDFWTSETIYPNYQPLPFVWWDRDQNFKGGTPRMTAAGRPYPGFLRILCDGMDGIMEACKYVESAGGNVPEKWMETVLRVANFFYEKQEADGCLRRAYDVQTGNINTDKSDESYQGDSKLNTASVVPFFYKISDYYAAEGMQENAAAFAAAAKKATDYVYDNIYLTLQKYIGGTIDQHNIVDKEAGIFAMRAFTAAYIATGEEKYLAAAENAGCFVLTFIYTYDFAVPCGDPYQNSYNPFKNGGASGFSIIATGHSNADIFSSYTVYDFYKLYLLSGNETYRNIAVFIENNSKQAVDYDGRHGFLYRGTSPEASQLANFNYSTVDIPGIWLPWNTDACIRPMSDLQTLFGEYDIQKIEMSLSDQKDILQEYGLGGKIKH